MASKLTDREFAIMLDLCLNHDDFRPEGLDELLDPQADTLATEALADTADEAEAASDVASDRKAAAPRFSAESAAGTERGRADAACENGSQRGGWLSLPLLVACVAAICLIPACWLWLRDGVSAIEESAVEDNGLFQYPARQSPPGQSPASESFSETPHREPAGPADLLAGKHVATHPLLAPRDRLSGAISRPAGATPPLWQQSP